jgi:hypothetical protein
VPSAVAERDATERATTAIVVAAIAGLTLLIAVVAFARYARDYFFLFDDFALVHIARSETVARIVSQPLIGFYRPLPFWALRGEALAFSWDSPAAYITVSLLLHGVNAALCFLLTRTFNPPRFAPALAACLFLLSPWATEAFLWVSGRFDVMATLGTLAALLGVRLAVAANAPGVGHSESGNRYGRDARVPPAGPRRPGLPLALAFALALGGSLCGLFSKEHAIVLPALAVLAAAADRPLRSMMRPAPLLAIGATAVPVVLYLVLRASLLGALQGAYGSFSSLWREAHVFNNVWSYLRAFVWVPSRPAWPPQDIALTTVLSYAFVGVVLPVALISLVWRCRRLAAVCGAGFLVSVVPVSWFGLSAQSTIGGRFAYLPAIWLIIALACGLAAAIDALPARFKVPAPLIAGLVLPLTFGYMGASLLYQVELWQLACRLSKTTFEQVERYRGRTGMALEIENMPHISAEGPYVLKAYAFRFYRDGESQPLPPINAHMALVKLAWNGQDVATLGVDATSDFTAGVPAGLALEHIRLTLTQSIR